MSLSPVPIYAVGLTRVSSRDQEQHGYGLEVQAQRVTEFCRTQGWELLSIEGDGAERGDRPLAERPGLLAALRVVRDRREDPIPVTRVVVDRFDRLGREAYEALTAEREFLRLGAQVEYVAGMNGDDPQTKFMRHVMHGLAELDKDLLIAKWADGKRAKAAKGGYVGGRPKVGFKAERKELVPDPAAAPVLLALFRAIAAGQSTRRVARTLAANAALGQRWDAGKVRGIVRDPRYKAGGAGRALVDPRIWAKANAALDMRRPGHARRATAAA